MAKIRRIIRKLDTPADGGLDEQAWPVNVALVVLGGFSLGASLAYLRLDDPRPWANAGTYLILVPLVVGGAMLAFRYISSKFFRRSMQLALVASALVHLFLVILSAESVIFSSLNLDPKTQTPATDRRAPENALQISPDLLTPQDDQPRDFEKPVETETPNVEPDPTLKKEETQEDTSPRTPQPVPVPEPQRTRDPAVVKRPTTEQAAPRASDTASLLSRNTKVQDVNPAGAKVALEKPSQKPSEDKMVASAAGITRQTTDTKPTTRSPEKEPTSTPPSESVSIAKKTPDEAQKPDSTATATLNRALNLPKLTPKSQINDADAPSVAKRNSETEPIPNNTAATRKTTAGPAAQKTIAEPTTLPTTVTEPVAAKPQLETKPEPTVATSPTSIASRQPRVTPRPAVAVDSPRPSETKSNEPTTPTPQSTSVARSQSASVSEKPTSGEPAAAPNSPDATQVASRVTRTESSRPSPTLANSSATPSRRTGTPGVPSPSAQAENVAVVESAASAGELTARATETRRSETVSPAAARSAGNPTPEAIASATPSATPGSAPSRISATNPSPNAGQAAATTSVTGRSATGNAPNVVTRVANVEATSGPSASQTISASASSALASRQNAAANPNAASTQPSLDAPTTGAGTPLAGGGMTRANNSSSPSLNPSAVASNSPQRASRNAPVAGSPSNVESPAVATATAGSSDPTTEPARMALNRSQSGVAGAGNSPNLDRGSAAGDSPALVASVAARRNQATSAGPADSALTPSTAATRANSRASANTPASSVAAESLANANEGGTPQAGEIASSSAAVNRATGSAAPGEVSAAKGTAEIDVGATTIVSEAGRARAAGGGQPEMSFDPQMGNVARQKSSGSPQASIAADKVASVPEAPMATGGGQPASLDPSATLAVRGDAASGSAGGPSKAEDKGPLAEPSAAALVADNPASRADASQGAAAGAGGGTPSLEDEEEKAKRLARAALGGSPQIATAATQVSNVPAAPMGQGGSGGSLATGDTAPTNTATGRTVATGGATATGGLPSAGENTSAGANVGAAAIAKAEAASAAKAPTTVTGGGTGTPAKAAGGNQVATNAAAETLQLAGAPVSGGGTEGVPLQAQGIEASKTTGGAPSQVVEGAIGAAAGKEVVDAFGPQGAGNVAGGSRTVSPGLEDGPSITEMATGGGPGKRGTENTIAGEAGKVEVPIIGPASAVAQADLDHGMSTGVGRTASDAGEGLVVNLEAPEGVGGLGKVAAADVGINSRLARADSVEIAPQPSRFVGRRSGGVPGLSTASIVPTDSFKKRAEGRAGKGSLPPQTEAAVELGLAYLSRHQQNDGSWRLQGHETTSRADPQMVSDTSATALAVLAFQGAGYNHREHKYAAVVRNGLDYLVQNQKEDGDLFVPLDDESNRSVWLYSHALASLALCEAYGMTQDPALKEPAQKSIDFIIAGQHKERGGWRYAPGVGTDTSVTGAMLVALRSAELANLHVPKSAYDGVTKWLDQSQASPTQAHLYRYNPNAPDTETQRHGKVASPTMTSLGLLMRLYLGWKRDNPNMLKGADYLKENLPALGTNTDPKRDTYYWYYATQVMFHMGGEHWKQWHDKLHTLLIGTQIREGAYAGSWNPRLPVVDRWGPHGGRLYVTALNLLSLEVQYRHLPTYEDTAK